jgi:hypothetical protein
MPLPRTAQERIGHVLEMLPAVRLGIIASTGGEQMQVWVVRPSAAMRVEPRAGAAIPHRGPDLDAFLSIKPRIPLSQELEQVLVLVGQIENHESLSWDVEHMNPHEVMEYPACGRVLDALTFLAWKGCSMLLEGRADTVFEGRIDEQTDRHDHQQSHDPLGLFEIKGRSQKLRVFQEAKPPFRPGVPSVSVEHRLGRELALVQLVRREDKATLLVDACLTVCEPRSQGPDDMVDKMVGLGARAWAPSLAIVGRGADGAVVENRGLQACGRAA